MLLSFKLLNSQQRLENLLVSSSIVDWYVKIAKCDQAKLELKDKIAQFGDEVGFQISEFSLENSRNSKMKSQKVLLYTWSQQKIL